MIPKVILAGFIVAFAAPLCAGDLKLNLEVYEMKETLATALDGYLEKGKDGAQQAFARMPSLVSKGQVTKRNTLKTDLVSTKRVKVNGGGRKIGDRNYTSTEGINLEIDPIRGPSGIVELLMSMELHESKGSKVDTKGVVTAISVQPDFPTPIHSWTQGDKVQTLFVTASHAFPVDLTKAHQALLRSRIKVVDVGNSATAQSLQAKGAQGAEEALRIGKVIEDQTIMTRSGQRMQTRNYVHSSKEFFTQKNGFMMEVDSTLAHDRKTFDMAIKVEGYNRDKFSVNGIGTHLLKVGEKGVIALKEGAKPIPYVVVVEGKVWQIGEAKPATKVVAPPAAPVAKGKILVRKIPVKPNFLRAMKNKYNIHQNQRYGAKELFKKAGIQFPKGCTASFKADESILFVTNTAEGLKKIEKIVKSLP